MAQEQENTKASAKGAATSKKTKKQIKSTSSKSTKSPAKATQKKDKDKISSAIDATDIQRQNLTQSISTLKDTDVAKESSNYIKFQILQQSAATLLATANQQPQIALNLL